MLAGAVAGPLLAGVDVDAVRPGSTWETTAAAAPVARITPVVITTVRRRVRPSPWRRAAGFPVGGWLSTSTIVAGHSQHSLGIA